MAHARHALFIDNARVAAVAARRVGTLLMSSVTAPPLHPPLATARPLWRRASHADVPAVDGARRRGVGGLQAVGPQNGGDVLGWKILPRSKDSIMPHLSDIISPGSASP
jgi:hypothetical protein